METCAIHPFPLIGCPTCRDYMWSFAPQEQPPNLTAADPLMAGRLNDGCYWPEVEVESSEQYQRVTR